MAVKCTKCWDTHMVEDEYLGIQVECDCVRQRIAEESKKASEDKALAFILKQKENNKANIEIAKSNGIIPECRLNDVLDMDILLERKIEQYGNNIARFEEYSRVLSTIYVETKMGNRIDRSYLIGAPKGLSKTTFVYSCIKNLMDNGKKVVPYVTLSEAFVLYNNHVRRMNSAKYLCAPNKSNKYDAAGMDYSIEYEEEVVKELKGFTWRDFLECDVLFINLSSPLAKLPEIDTLMLLLDCRGRSFKPTIVMTSLGPTNYYYGNYIGNTFFNEYIDKTSGKYPSYGRLKHVSCFNMTEEFKKKQENRVDVV